GPYGVGKRTTAGALCHLLGLKLLVVNGEHQQFVGSEFASTVRLITREAALQDAAVYWHGFDSLLADDQRSNLTLLLQEMTDAKGVVFLAGETVWEPSDNPQLPPFVRIEFPHPTFNDRLLFWEIALKDVASANVDAAGLANKFRFTGGQI